MRIFNRIRRKLLEELKIHNYLLYAMGEILLITAGVMIGLYLNNWNQDQSNQNEETRLLSSLQESFRSNRREIDSSLLEYADELRVTDLRIAHTGPAAELPERQTLDSMIGIDYVRLSYISGGSAPVMTQERLSLLSSQKLIIELSRYPIQYTRYRAAEATVNELADQLRDIHQQHVSLLTEEIRFHAGADDRLTSHPSDYRAWLRDRTNQNKSVESKWKLRAAVAELEQLRADTTRILELIDAELQRFERRV